MIQFDRIAADLLSRSESFCRELFPAGKVEGGEYRIGDVSGAAGKSLSINLKTGVWKDFGGDDAGADLISLYAAHHGLSQADAARQIAPQWCNGHDHGGNGADRSAIAVISGARQEPGAPTPVTPPANPPEAAGASALYRYTDSFYVARFDKPDGAKSFTPYSWDGQQWNKKAPAKPRPLYGLDQLAARPDAPVLVVEGEKTAHAAAEALPAYVVMTWASGASSTATADWSALYGRSVDIWPDADEPGRKAAALIGAALLPHCPRVRIVGTEDAPSVGWDIADAVAAGWTGAAIVAWGKPRLTTLNMPDPKPKAAATKREPAGAEPPPGETLPAYVLWEQLQLARNDRGPYATEANALRVMASHGAYAGRIWLDEFSQRLMIDDDSSARLFSRTDAIACLVWMQEALQLPKMPLSAVERAAVMVGERNKRHPVKQYLESVTWDGIDRLARLLPDGFGAPDTPYSAAVGRCWLTAMIARVYQPGCKADNMPVFEGPQGILKSSALSVIGGPWFLETTENPLKSRKDFLLALQGKLLVEIPEIDRIGGKHGSLDDLTGIITIRTDSYRVPYGATTMDYPRQSIFAGTTNKTEWQPDETGGRRYWPVTCGNIELDWIADSRDQLFAEAVARYQRGESWWDVPGDDARAEQEARRTTDAWEEIVAHFFTHFPRRDQGKTWWNERDKPLRYTTVGDVLEYALDMPESKWDTPSQKRVVRALLVLGFKRQKIRIEGIRTYVYAKPNAFTDKDS